MAKTLADIAAYLGAELVGDGQVEITGLATLTDATRGQLAFLANPAYRDQLGSSAASAVILHRSMLELCKTNALVLDNPYLGYAKVSSLFDTLPAACQQVHERAWVSKSAQLGQGVTVGANAVIEDHAVLEDYAVIGPGSVIGARSRVGKNTLIHANVTLYHDVVIGERCIVHSGVVLGADGFGFAPDKGQWHKIRQIGGVLIGNDVEIGANTSIDRGALSDTRIGNGVKLDNQIQIAHNVQIGDNAAMAACVGIAGSTKIGANVTLSGGVGVSGHLEIAAGTHITAMSLVTKSITEAGSYSSGTAMAPSAEWKKSAVRFRQLDEMAKKIKALENAVKG